MKRNALWTRKILLSTLIALVFSTAMVLIGTSSPIPAINQTDPATTVYLNPPTINGTVIDETFTVNLTIRDAQNIYNWQAGLTFNATLLECTGFFEGEFLKSVVGSTTYLAPGTINNTAGMIKPPFVCTFLGDFMASGDGRLAYATFKVKALGVSDIHLSNVKVVDYDLNMVPVNIIDVYTVVVDTTAHTVVTVSNLTGATAAYGSGIYGHAFDSTLKQVSFKVTGPPTITDAGGIHEIHGSFFTVAIPKALLPAPESPRVWAVLINGIALTTEKVTKTENATHTSIYFVCPPGLNDVQITTRFRSSIISIALSKSSIRLGETITISGAIDPVRTGVNVTIQFRPSGVSEWTTLDTAETDTNGQYTYDWKPEEKGTYEIMTSWDGDVETLRDESEVLPLTVKGAPGIPLEVIAIVVVAIIIAVAIVVYFVKFRKPKSQ